MTQPSSRALGPLRQQVIFPPYEFVQRPRAMVRTRHLLVELQQGTVFHLRVPLTWDSSPARTEILVNVLKRHFGKIQSREELASAVGWAAETSVELLDFDLYNPSTACFPVRATALERCLSVFVDGETTPRLMERVALEEKALTATLGVDITNFLNSLDPDIVALSCLWNGMPWERYNWFARVGGKERVYRIQAAKVFPALIPVLAGEIGKPGRFVRSLCTAIDMGHSLVDALAMSFSVRAVTARHALSIPPELVAGEKLPTLVRALDKLAPDRFPRESSEWSVFERLVFDVIPKITDRPTTSPINLSFLPAISGHGWVHAEKLLSGLSIGVGAASLYRGFLDAYKSVTWDLTQTWREGHATAQVACDQAIAEALARLNVLRVFETARSFPSLRQAAHAELAHRHQILRGEVWSGILHESMVFERCDCQIEPVLSLSAMTELGNALGNCLSRTSSGYAAACVEGWAHVFAIRRIGGSTELLGAFALRLHPTRHGKYLAEVFECKGPHNTPVNYQGSAAVGTFCEWIRADETQRRIVDFRRTRLTRGTSSENEVQLRINMETTIAALRKVRQKSLRFDAIRNRVMGLLGVPCSDRAMNGDQLSGHPDTENSSQ